MENTLYTKFRTNFLSGLFFVLPLVATIWIVSFLIDLISGPLSLLLGQRIPELLSFLITLIIITFIGFVVRNFIGKVLVRFFENLMGKIPIINIIYTSIKQIINAFSFQNKGLLKAVLVEYPRKGVWAMGFLTKDDAAGLMDSQGNDFGAGMCSVFMPTTPNPTSGYFLYVPKSDVKELQISVENSIKILMSAGVISPADAK